MSFPIIIISGLPGTGKTFLAAKVSHALKIPAVSKDGFKEIMFDNIGIGDREWSRKLGKTSMRLLDYVLLTHLETAQPLIMECNFNPKFENERFTDFAKKYDVQFIQVFCHAPGEILLERFKRRAESDERHPGHGDKENVEELRHVILEGRTELLDIPGERIDVDTADFASVNYEDIIAKVRSLIVSKGT